VNGPDFICIGAQKAGTGWLYEQLRTHPDFWMPPIKEIHYFDRNLRTARPSAGNRFDTALKQADTTRDREFIEKARHLFADAQISPAGYADLFASRGSLLSGDITPGYSILPEETVATVAASFPKAKILFLARDPVERAWSQISMWVRHGRIPRFDAANVGEVKRLLANPGVAARSFPSEIVRRWKQQVSAGEFYLYFFDNLRTQPANLRETILRALGADPSKGRGDLPAGYNAKARLEKLPFTDDVRREMAYFFRQELEACAAELGGPAAQWPSRYGF
jgi:hypothetical protein